MVLFAPGVAPDPNSPLVEFEHPDKPARVTVKSPKSDAFPVDDIVTKSIVFVLVGVAPPPNTLRVVEEQLDKNLLDWVKSPKSTAFPIDAIVLYSITFIVKYPPAHMPRVALDVPVCISL